MTRIVDFGVSECPVPPRPDAGGSESVEASEKRVFQSRKSFFLSANGPDKRESECFPPWRPLLASPWNYPSRDGTLVGSGVQIDVNIHENPKLLLEGFCEATLIWNKRSKKWNISPRRARVFFAFFV